MTATILLVPLMCFAGLKAIDYTSSRIVAPVVLNSLPRSVIKCTPGAIEGLCANDEYAKNWEAMQK